MMAWFMEHRRECSRWRYTGRVRRAVRVEGRSQRSVATGFWTCPRETVRKMLQYAVRQATKRQRPDQAAAKLGPMGGLIDRHSGKMTSRDRRKQRHTAKRIFERLKEEQRFHWWYTDREGLLRVARQCRVERWTISPTTWRPYRPNWSLQDRERRASGNAASVRRSSLVKTIDTFDFMGHPVGKKLDPGCWILGVDASSSAARRTCCLRATERHGEGRTSPWPWDWRLARRGHRVRLTTTGAFGQRTDRSSR